MTAPVVPYSESGSPRVSDRSRGVALALAAVLGIFGAHRFYAGKVGSGICMICTLGGLGLWWLADVIVVAAGEFRDGEGRKVSRWQGSDEVHGSSIQTGVPRQQLDQLTAQIDALQAEVTELGERLDFAERLLTQRREREGLPGE